MNITTEIWVIGWLFTFGYIVRNEDSVIMIVLESLFAVLLWPLAIGFMICNHLKR